MQVFADVSDIGREADSNSSIRRPALSALISRSVSLGSPCTIMNAFSILLFTSTSKASGKNARRLSIKAMVRALESKYSIV
ncbi:hypothetical protein D3C75_956220 [compost metagenome]